MKRIFRLVSLVSLLAFLFTLAPAALLAQTDVACEEDVTVQADDWLSKYADKFYGDPLAFPAIVEATNASAGADSSYATIENPDLIEIGWKVCIPSAADAQALLTGAAPEASAAPPPTETTIWFGAGSTLLDPYLVPIFTVGRDLLAEKGIVMEFVTLSTDEAVEAALDRSRVDVGLLSTVGLNRAVSQGLTMKFAVGIEMHNTFVLTTRSEVTDLSQLAGKKIAAQSRTSLSVAVGEVMMAEQAGLVSGEDFEMVFLPGSDNRAAAMEAGSIDAAVLFRAVASDLEKRSNGEFKIYGGLWDVLDPMLWEGLAFSEEFRTENPALAATFVETMLETYQAFNAGDPATMAAMKEGIPEAEPLDTDALIGDYELYQVIGLYPEDGGLDPLFYNRMTDFLVQIGQLEPDQVVPYEQAVDTSFLLR